MFQILQETYLFLKKLFIIYQNFKFILYCIGKPYFTWVVFHQSYNEETNIIILLARRTTSLRSTELKIDFRNRVNHEAWYFPCNSIKHDIGCSSSLVKPLTFSWDSLPVWVSWHGSWAESELKSNQRPPAPFVTLGRLLSISPDETLISVCFHFPSYYHSCCCYDLPSTLCARLRFSTHYVLESPGEISHLPIFRFSLQ